MTPAALAASLHERVERCRAELAANEPQRLSKAAKRKLAGKDEATVSLHSGGKLSRWAAHERAKAAKAKRKSRARRAAEKATRKAQRRKR